MKDRFAKIHSELRKKGLVTTRLSKNTHVPNLKRSLIYGIVYNPRYSHLDKDVIRFLVLHEEGHGKLPIAYPLIFLVFILTTVIGSFISINPVLDFILTFIIFFGILRLFIPVMRWEEYKADRFAVDVMVREYGIEDPERIVAKALDALTGRHKRKTFISGIYMLMPYHPSREDRLAAVRDRVAK